MRSNPNTAKSNVFYRRITSRKSPPIAIVGTRKPTSYGREVAHRLAYELAKKASSLSAVLRSEQMPLRTVEHLRQAARRTLAVLANGVETIYPRSHEALAKEIIASGRAILSEYEPPTGARAYQFLARNRIVSGLSDAVIVVEAAARSGTLSTAAHALEQGKEVFAVPGNIASPLSAGCNALLKQGAHPVTGTEDILEVIAPQYVTRQSILPLGTTPLETKIIELLQSGIRDGDQLQ